MDATLGNICGGFGQSRGQTALIVDGIPLLVSPGEAFDPAATGGCAKSRVGDRCPVATTSEGLHASLDCSRGRAVLNMALRLDGFTLDDWRKIGKMAAVAVFLPGAPVARMLVQLQGVTFQAPMIINRDAGDRQRSLDVLDSPGEKSIEFIGVRGEVVACIMLCISTEGIWSALRRCVATAPEEPALGAIRRAMLRAQENTTADEMFSAALQRHLAPRFGYHCAEP